MILSESELGAMSVLALAHMGDAVYELLARRELCRRGGLTASDLHRQTVRMVAAAAQAKAARALLPVLSEPEQAVFRRGRNTRSHAAPPSCTEAEYHMATALEALFGWLYLREEKERIEELFALILEDHDAPGRHSADGAAP